MIFNLNSNNPIDIKEDIRGDKTTTTVSVTTTLAVALAANPKRAVYTIYNAGPATILMREGPTVTAALYDVAIPSGFYWKEDFGGSARYLGQISVITAGGTASLQVSQGSLP
jgi:hypothetical protein